MDFERERVCLRMNSEDGAINRQKHVPEAGVALLRIICEHCAVWVEFARLGSILAVLGELVGAEGILRVPAFNTFWVVWENGVPG